MATFLINGFETGDASQVTTVGAGQAVLGSTGVFSGNYGWQNRGDGTTRSETTFASQGAGTKTHVFGTVKFLVGNALRTGPPAVNWQTDWALFDNTAAQIFTPILQHDGSGSYTVFINGAVGNVSSVAGQSIITTNFNLLEFEYNSGTSGAYNIWLNGVLILTGTGNFGTNPAASFKFGVVSGGTFTDNDALILDDMALSDSTQLGDVRVISRVSKAGTPTNNTWTKSTASTIDTVWEDTPFNATDFARSAVSNDAQTALMASFSSTQAGHGGGTISGSDTIWGIANSFVAKTVSTDAATITSIGTPQGGFSTAGADVTLTFSTAPLSGDVVIVTGGHILRTGSNYGPSTAGYTILGTLQTSGASGTGIAFGAWYKVMGDTPDTTVVCQGSGGVAGDGVAYTARVFRQNSNGSTLINATTVFAGPTTSTNPDPPAITPTTTSACVVIAAGSLISDTNIGGATNYTGQVSANAAATRPYSTSSLHRIGLTGGVSENPPAIGSIGNAWASGIWFSVSIALRPASETGAALDLLRIMAGTPTNTSFTVTTSDAYYQDVVFTDTLTNINTAEVGATHGDNSIRQTVEDIYMQVAYTPVIADDLLGQIIF
jgi:hypothetical protein